MQSLYPEQFEDLIAQVRQIAAVVGREIVAIGAGEVVRSEPAPAR
jgi:hypothetical protein